METTNKGQSATAVVILAGGLGTRLRLITGDTPKPLVNILGRPFIEYLIDHLRSMGFEDFFVAAHYRVDLVRRVLQRYRERTGARIEVIEEPVASGTFGAVRFAESVIPIQFSTLLVLNGDSLVDADYRDLVMALPGRDGVIAGVEVPDCGRFGSIRVDANGRIRAFAEKTGLGAGTVNAGVYAFRRAAVSFVDLPPPSSMERDFMPRAVQSLHLGLVDLGPAPFIDIGTPESYEAASRFPLIVRLRGESVGL